MGYFLRVCLALVTPGLLYAQSVFVGAVGGGRITDDLNGATSQSKAYVVGPSFELTLPLGFAFEADALYRCEGYQIAFGNFAGSFFSVERANSWEFPLLAKYRLPLHAVRPFAEVGYAPRVLRGSVSSDFITDFNSSGFLPQPVYSHSVSSTNWPASQGIVVGGGVEFRLGRLKLAPSVRYTHWNNAAITEVIGDGPTWQSSQNQVDVIVGIGWKLR